MMVAAHKNMEAPQNINRAMPESLRSRFPILNFPIIAHLTANDKDFSATLSMTIRESNVSQSLSL